MKTRHFLAILFATIATLSAYAAEPKVTTNARFARGATIAFGRMSYTGFVTSQIAQRGFCWGTTPEPTPDDNYTTSTLSNNGLIYVLNDLEPATKYYMRAYVKTTDGNVVYGNAIKFYTLPKGTMSYGIRDGGDANARQRIKAATEEAVNYWNNFTNIQGVYFNVGHNPGTPTADCSYGGYIRVGDNQSYQRTGTLLHEMLHGVGVGTNEIWWNGNLRADGDRGNWLGDRATEVLRFWDNDNTAVLKGDNTHMWPYGINGAHEDSGTKVLYYGNSLICQALMEDGLEPSSNHFANPYYAFDQEDDVKYYLKNEDEEHGFYTSYLVEQADGTLAWKTIEADQLASTDEAAWYITFTPKNQFYQFRNAATGHYISLSGTTVRTATSLSANTDFHLMRSRIAANGTSQRGYWLLHHAARSPRGLAAATNGKVQTEVFNIANSATTQRWVIATAEQSDALNTEAMNTYRSKVAGVVAQLKALMAVPHTEDAENTDEAFTQAINEIEQAAGDATSVIELAGLFDQAKQAQFNFLTNVTPTDIAHPFDLTFLIQNPGMDSSEGWSDSPTINYSCAEYYQKTFDFNQTLQNMPAGTYQLRAQAFQRPGSTADAYNYFSSGQTSKINTMLYAGGKTTRVKNICEEAQSRKLGVGNEVTIASSPVKYVPNDMQSVANYFKRGLYDNEVNTTVARDGASLKIGIRCSSAGDKYWSIFDNFRLYYFGSLSLDEVTGIEALPQSLLEGETIAIYDLSGRKVGEVSGRHGSLPLQLPKGIYIVNGKKVVIR